MEEVLLEAGFKVSETYIITSELSLLVDQDVSSQLLLQCHSCLPAGLFPAMTVTDSNTPFETVIKPPIKNLFFCSSSSQHVGPGVVKLTPKNSHHRALATNVGDVSRYLLYC